MDVSHLYDKGFWDVAEINKGPFIASHSNCRAMCNISRNLSDDRIRTIAERKGVIGMNFPPSFLAPRGEIAAGRVVKVSDVVDHIDHIVGLGGANHTGLGSDFNRLPNTPEGLEGSHKMTNITIELANRGYSEEDIKRILGCNFLRVIRMVLG